MSAVALEQIAAVARRCSTKIKVTSITVVTLLSANWIFAGEALPTSDFDQGWLKALVSIEISNDSTNGQPIGSGFLVETPGKHVAVVTAKHVVIDANQKLR